MTLSLTWIDIVVRLMLTMAAAGLIGLDREAGGHNAGLRTTLLVGLAAAVAMIQANLLLPFSGKTPASFAVLDLMRLPLGILTGVGFIGGGAILKKDNLVAGVTTAGTLWITTVIGLCFGGGQIALGGAATVLTIVTLTILKRVDDMIIRERHAHVTLGTMSAASIGTLQNALGKEGYIVRLTGVRPADNSTRLEVSWRCRETDCDPAKLIGLLRGQGEIQTLDILSDGRN